MAFVTGSAMMGMLTTSVVLIGWPFDRGELVIG
jgi:hypothetical protein